MSVSQTQDTIASHIIKVLQGFGYHCKTSLVSTDQAAWRHFVGHEHYYHSNRIWVTHKPTNFMISVDVHPDLSTSINLGSLHREIVIAPEDPRYFDKIVEAVRTKQYE